MTPRTTAEWWMVIRFGICCVPPARAGRAPHASRHNMADDVAVELGDAGAVASVVAIAVALGEGLVDAAGFGAVAVLAARSRPAHAAIKAARPRPPVCNSRRRLTAFMRCP